MAAKVRAVSLVLGLAATALILTLGCPADRSGGGPAFKLLNDAGEEATAVQSYDSLRVSLEGKLEPRTHYTFTVTPEGAAVPVVGEATLSTDQAGYLPEAFLLFDVGQGGVPPGTYDVTVTGPDLEVRARIAVEPPTGPYVYSCDVSGKVQNSFSITQVAFAAGGNFPPHTELHLVMPYDRPEWRDGDPILAGGPNGMVLPQTVTTDANGDIPVTQFTTFGRFADLGDGFDVVADFPPYDVFNEGVDAVDGHAVVGITFQGDSVGTDVDTDVACNEAGIYIDHFSPSDDVYAWVNPPLQYSTSFHVIDKYVCNHKDQWNNGDALVDVSGGNESDGVQSGCINEYNVIVFPGPIPPGEYDVILDLDQNGLYTQGIDIIDGGTVESYGKVGFTVN